MRKTRWKKDNAETQRARRLTQRKRDAPSTDSPQSSRRAQRGWRQRLTSGGMPPRVSRSCVRDAPPHTPVFCKKSLDLLDCKGFDFFYSGKEAATICRERSYV